MTLEDLREHGVLLPEEEWGEHRLETTVPEWPLLAAFVAAAVLWWVAYFGDGSWVTGVAVAAFLAVLYAITWVCDRGVLAQRRRFREEHRSFVSQAEERPGGGQLSAGGGEGPDDAGTGREARSPERGS